MLTNFRTELRENMEFDVIIPARHASTRLPGKLLSEVGGKPLIQWTWENARGSAASRVLVATDDERIMERVEAFGGEACMTSAGHESGTDRIAEAAALLGLADERLVVNVQGDEPELTPALIDAVAATLDRDPDAEMATASHALPDAADFKDPNVVKVVIDESGRALYFSRAPIPFHREDPGAPQEARRHVGIYAYRAGFLRRFSAWPPSRLEQAEKLEQLRALERGVAIAVHQSAEAPGPGIDTADDLARFRARHTG
jgi:3-deoxy-manno-octulosonate cytidylyltransferase (CMP-KDO synthetase)